MKSEWQSLPPQTHETMEKENIRLVAAAIEKANGGTPMNSEYRHV